MSSPGRYRWVIVGVGALATCVAFGAMFSLAVFLGPMSVSTGWSRAAISMAMTFDFLFLGVAGFAWGAASDRFGARGVVLCGAVLLGLGFLVASRATSAFTFQLGFGVLVGIAAGAFFPPIIALVTGWFDTQRALAVSLVSVGVGVAPMTVSPFAAWLVSHYDWRTAMAVIGAFAWVLVIPAAWLLRPPPSPDAASAPATVAPSSRTSLKAALASPQFLVLGGTYFFCCAAHSGPIFHIVSYAISCGVPTMAAVSIYSVEGLGGLAGRLLLGVSADRWGAKRVLICGLLVQSLAISGYLFANRLNEFYMLSVVFGTAYGGVMPLYATLARDYFDQRIMGSVFGAATLLSSSGMALGPEIGGWVFDTYHDYRWLYMGSFGLALTAAAVAIAFPRPSGESGWTARQGEPQPAANQRQSGGAPEQPGTRGLHEPGPPHS